MGVWCGWLVIVGGGFSICGLCASGEAVWWRVYWRWLIGGGVDVVICFVFGHVLRCGVCPWRYSLGVRLRGGLLVGVRFVNVVVIRELGSGILVLLEACGISRLPVFCCASGDKLSPVASLSGVRL